MRGGLAQAAALAVAATMAVAAAAPQEAHAEPYMSVSADDEAFGRTFAGSMVVEVVVSDPDIRGTGEAAGEPSVAVDGEPLRMVQASDGSWHAYFADIEAAMAADAAAVEAGQGTDFGVFCAPSAAERVLGASFADADAVAVARAVDGGTDGGDGPPGECEGTAGGELLNNVVRRAPRVSGAGGERPGQIGVDPAAWPVVQLYSLGGSVVVEYKRAGGTERAELEYDEIPNVAMSLDRTRYPAGAEVYVTISDAQLNQDPTDRDAWVFSTDPESPAVFYMGGWDGGGGMPAAAADLYPRLRSIGFEDNGALTIDAGRTVAFKPNGLQPGAAIRALGEGGQEHSSLVTVRETRASSSEFVSHDGNGESTVWVPRDAPRGTAAVFEYNDERVSALTGPATATVGIGAGAAGGGAGDRPAPGTRSTVTISDADRNANPARRDVLSASGPGPVPSVRIGSPLTLAGSGGAWWLADGEDDPAPAAHSSIDSDRMAVARPGAGGAATLIVDAGYGADAIRGLQGGPSARSTVWLNYDVRSLAGPGGQPGATIGLAFGGRAEDAGAGMPAEVWDASAGRGTVRIIGDHGDGRGVAAFAVHLPAGAAAAAAAGDDAAPVHIDLFSFGVRGGGDGIVNNAVYRLELEETGAASGVFEGTVEYVVMDERSGADPALAASLVAYGDDVRIATGGDMTGDDAVTVSYRDVGGAGTPEQVAADADAPSHAGSVHLGAASYGFGRPVTITLVDADLNTDHARVETYRVDDDPASPHADAVADGGALLLEVTIKGERYKRCVVDGAEHGGLAASGFALVETGAATGVFEGTFKMPSWICNSDGSGLVSPAGGRIDARYYDYADGRGGSSIVDASPRAAAPAKADPGAGAAEDVGESGQGAESEGQERQAAEEPRRAQVPSDARQIAMLRGGQMSDADLFRVMRSVIEADTVGGPVPAAQDGAGQAAAPAWFKTVAGWWGDGRISDHEFAAAARYVLDAGIVRPPG